MPSCFGEGFPEVEELLDAATGLTSTRVHHYIVRVNGIILSAYMNKLLYLHVSSEARHMKAAPKSRSTASPVASRLLSGTTPRTVDFEGFVLPRFWGVA